MTRLPPSESVRKALARLSEINDPAIFKGLKSESDLLAEAAALEQQGNDGKPLFGLVFAVKDNIDAEGLDTTAACPAFAYRPGNRRTDTKSVQGSI